MTSNPKPNHEEPRQKRKSLSDILAAGSDREKLRKQWDVTQAAIDFAPLPRGEYVAHITSGELFNASTGMPGYKLTFEVLDGEHAGRKFWHDVWLSEPAMAMAKRDLAKLGVTSIDQLEQPLPPGLRCQVKLAVRKDDDGAERNRVTTFEVIGIDTPELDPFAPTPVNDAVGAVPPSTPPITTAKLLPDDDADNQAQGKN